jgi:DNA invertase Pin-like site-specific DNA recombinase
MVGSDTPENFLMEHLIVGMAEFYSRNLSREIMKGLKQRALQGHWSSDHLSAIEKTSSRNRRATSAHASSAARWSMKRRRPSFRESLSSTMRAWDISPLP